MKACPFCGEQIQDVAVKCRYCGEWLDASKRPDAQRPQTAAHEHPGAVEPGVAGRPQRDPDALPVDPPRMIGPRTELWVAPPGHSDMSGGTGPNEQQRPGNPPPWNPPPESINASTIRGVPPSTIPPSTGSGRFPTLLPEAEKRPVELGGSLGVHPLSAAQPGSAALAQPLPAPTQPPAPASFGAQPLLAAPISLAPQPVAPGPVLAEPPLPPAPAPAPAFDPASPLASPPLPASAQPPGAFQARPADDFIKSFLGAPEAAADTGGGDDDLFGASMTAPPPPPPWPLIGAVAAVIVAVGLYMFRDQLFSAEATPEPTPAETKTEPPPELKAEPKPEPAPETKAPPADAKAPADTKAAPTPPPAPSDPAFADKLARAKQAYSDGKLKVTAAALEDLSKQAPGHPEVLLLTAQVQLEEGKIADSQATADKCVAADPNLADCWLTLGVLRQHNKDQAGAIAAYETYLKLAPTGRYARDANSQLSRLRKAG